MGFGMLRERYTILSWCNREKGRENSRKYHKFLTDRDRLIGEEVLRRGILENRLSTAWLDDLMKEWGKNHTQLANLNKFLLRPSK